MTGREENILKARLNPIPSEIRFSGEDGFFKLTPDSVFHVETGVPLRFLLDNEFKLFFGFEPEIKYFRTGKEIAPDGYEFEITQERVTIRAARREGVLNSLKTLRQLAEPERGVLTTNTFELPLCSVEDSPKIAFRGIHICWFPENHAWQIERALRLAASYKFNYAVLETWGVFPFEKHPYLCWPGKGLDKQELKRMIADLKALGLTVIPQFNLLGHASGSRENGGKHVVLNNQPQYASLFEPDGWSWCISNPETRKVLTDCVTELHEFFENPPYFHMGCDEARLLGTCRTCRQQELRTLLKDHLLYFHDLLAKRGAQVIMWHDMLLNREDPRWDGYIVCGSEKEGLGDLYKELPKDMVIDDWQYGYPEKDGKEPEWPTTRFFHKEGFSTLISPCGNLAGLKSLSKLAAELPLTGVLETTWGDLDTGMFTTIFKAAGAIWHGGDDAKLNAGFDNGWAPDSMCFMHHHLRQVENDMNLRDYEAAGRIILQVPEKVVIG